jgi:hypothetical protein
MWPIHALLSFTINRRMILKDHFAADVLGNSVA